MAGINVGNLGGPGIGVSQTVTFALVSDDGRLAYKPGGGLIKNSKSRDPFNSDDITVLQVGTIMSKNTSDSTYAPFIIGNTSGAMAQAATSFTVSAASATEIVRRIGSTGNVVLTGPPTAAGTVRQVTVAYSAVNTSTGVVTCTTPSVNAVHTLGFTNSPAGNFKLRFVDLNGVVRTTGPIVYSATIGTLLSNINTAVDTAMGAGLIVASGTLVTAVAITYSGAGYLGLPQTLVAVDTDALTAGNVSVTNTTTGVDGRFIAGTIVGDTTYTTPYTFVGDDNPVRMPTSNDKEWPRIPMAGVIKFTNLTAEPTDTSLVTWVQNALSTTSGGKFIFTDKI